jgi:hypothetical protein
MLQDQTVELALEGNKVLSSCSFKESAIQRVSLDFIPLGCQRFLLWSLRMTYGLKAGLYD